MLIRQETESDYSQVFNLIQEAFEQSPGNRSEQFLVERLRQSNAFIPELSLVAEQQKEIVGHILLTKIKIKGPKASLEALALAPVSVKPPYQRQGIGGKLIVEAQNKARRMGYKAIALIGHQDYYPRFGYQIASAYNIDFPFEAPDENCMILELEKGSLKEISGTIEYPEEFFI
jgi:predicted N-acetyltransferase YhbS